jgi:hypothetical protein
MSSRLKYGLLEELANEIGYTATNSLVDWFGGARLFIPEVIHETHPIAQIIGMPAAAHLVKWMDRHEALGTFQTGDKGSVRRVWIGMNIQRENDRRDRMIVGMLKEGWGRVEVGRISGMAQTHVYKLQKRAEKMGMLPMTFEDEAGYDEISNGSPQENPPPESTIQKSPGKPTQETRGLNGNSGLKVKKPVVRGKRPAW